MARPPAPKDPDTQAPDDRPPAQAPADDDDAHESPIFPMPPRSIRRPARPMELSHFASILDTKLGSIYDPKGHFWGGEVAQDAATAAKVRTLEEEIATLRRRHDELTANLHAEQLSGARQQGYIQGLTEIVQELRDKESLGFILERVSADAKRALFESKELRDAFLGERTCETFVLSIDIRRSTDLMLKARTPEAFASFITSLSETLSDIVVGYHGVFDKFTGDGILAFFPDFFTGDDAGYLAVLAASKCHQAFEAHYRASRRVFNSVLQDAGLGIGIDYGQARLVRVGGGITVVGHPVVYACRMSGAVAGHTLLNQPAYEKISERFSKHCVFLETSIDIKHEGRALAYDVTLNGKEHTPAAPGWADASGSEGAREAKVET